MAGERVWSAFIFAAANAKIETIKDGFDGPVSLVQVGDTIYVLDVPLRYLLGQEAKDKKPPPPFKATAVPAPRQ